MQLFAQFQDFLIEEYASGRRTMLIFDEAQNLSVETLEELRMFSNINADKDELIQLVLVGQPELRDADRPAAARAVRPAGRGRVPPAGDVGRRRSQAYIAHRLAVAGASREIFTPGGLRVRASRQRAACRGSSTRSATMRWSTPSPTASSKVDAGVIEQVVTDRRMHGSLKMVAA